MQIQALSFTLDGEEEEEEEEENDSSDDKKHSDDDVPKKKIKKNPDVDTSFLPDREREEEETRLREELRQVINRIFVLKFSVMLSKFFKRLL